MQKSCMHISYNLCFFFLPFFFILYLSSFSSAFFSTKLCSFSIFYTNHLNFPFDETIQHLFKKIISLLFFFPFRLFLCFLLLIMKRKITNKERKIVLFTMLYILYIMYSIYVSITVYKFNTYFI